MPTRHKPRRGFKNIVDRIPVTKEKIESIEKKSGIILNCDLAEQLIESTTSYLSTKEVIDNWPRLSEIKPALEKIRNCAKEFMEVLDQLDPASRTVLISQSDWIDIESAIFQAQTIHGAAKDALVTVPVDEGGRPKQRALPRFITSLAAIFEEATGLQARSPTWHEYREKYEGHFFDFVRVCLEEITPKEIRSNSSLGQAIKKALKSATSFPYS